MIPLPQPATNHKVLQLAYVVNDVRAAAEKWIETFGVGPFYMLDRPQVGDPRYRGTPQPVEFSVGVAQAGDIHIERPGLRFHFPIVTCLLLSVAASALFWLFSRLL